MKKFNKTQIYLVCEGKIDTLHTNPKLLSQTNQKEFYVAKKWEMKTKLDVRKEVGKLEDISKIIAITTHREIAYKKLYDYVKRHGFSKIPNYDLFIMTEPLILNHDSTIVSVRRNYKAHKTILFDFVYKKFFNSKRYVPRTDVNGKVWQSFP